MWKKNYKNKIANEWTRNIYSCKQQFRDSNSAWVYNLKTYTLSLHTVLKSLYLKNMYFENICKRQEAVARRCSVKVFLDISQNSQENNCARVPFLIKFQASPATLLKKRLWHRSFPVNFAKFLRTPILTEHLWWLFLNGCLVHDQDQGAKEMFISEFENKEKSLQCND